MLNWLLGFFSKGVKAVTGPSEECRFIQALCEAHPEVNKCHYGFWIGYMHEFIVTFPEAKIELKYNDISGEWNMIIWDKSSNYIYYHDIISPAPWDAMSFVIDRFDVMKKLNLALERKRAEKKKSAEKIHNLKTKYLSKSNGN
jgi:hypothetical protein